LIGKLEGNRHLKDAGIDGRIILKCILRKLGEDVDRITVAKD
jgi:hypothetical protein